MLGGHLDSWHSATGATDNAIGCAIMMEAARILKVIGVQPRRTIRVALWSGEEEGLLGSLAYVKQHFGIGRNADAGVRDARRLPQHRLRHGAATRRLASSVRPRRPRSCARFWRRSRICGVAGASATTSRATGGTDSTSFNNAGLPGHRLRSGLDRVRQPHASHEPRHLRTRHRRGRPTTLRSWSRRTLYQLAMRDEMLPRFATADMPPVPPQRSGGH